ncbi:hypothetical protein [Actinoplanes sp. M2I2]|uniref:hypothetical protein n=1 Tax=Actinoplanes sp. M2I2 TaxID=1734444 RepID=UPI002021137D|nr:hypothetical protein [Actinoplanes sp. M2I2]
MTDDDRYWMGPDEGRSPSPAQPPPVAAEAQTAPGVPSVTHAKGDAAPALRASAFGRVPEQTRPSTAAEQRPPTVLWRRRWALPTAIAIVATLVGGGALVASRAGDDRPGTPVRAVTTRVKTIGELNYGVRDRVVNAIAQRRSAALRDGDLAAWLADIAPTATKIIAQERMRFANLRQLDLNSFDLLPHDYSIGLFDDADPNTIKVAVFEIMRLSADVQRSASHAHWSLTFDGERAQITGITVQIDEKFVSNAPWDFLPLRSARGAGVTVYAAADGRWDPRAYLPAAQRAARQTRALWGKRLAVPGFVVFLADRTQYTTWYSTGVSPGESVGFTSFAPVITADGLSPFAKPNPTVLHAPNEPSWIERSAGSRIVLDMSRLAGTRDLQSVLLHEFAHGIAPHLVEFKRFDFGPAGTTNQAIWPVEGFARWVEFLDQPHYGTSAMRSVRTGRAKYKPAGPLPASEGFYSGDAKQRSYNYNLSASPFLAAEQTGGRQKAVDLYICLTNSREFLADSELFINVCVTGVGLGPVRFWSRQHELTR